MKRVIKIILSILGSMLITGFILSLVYFVATGNVTYLLMTFTPLMLIFVAIGIYNILHDLW